MTGITFIQRITGSTNNIVYLETTDTSATATAAGYITAQAANISEANEGAWTWETNDCIMLSASDGISWCSINSTFTTLDAFAGFGSGDVTFTSPSVANALAVFTNTSGNIADNIAGVNSVTVASATPGTVRSLVGKITDSVLMTSGNIVGVRGEADYVGASGGFIYGVQGKIIPTGSLSGSSWNIGVFGQLDISGATVNAGQMAPIWGDYGATSGTLTNQTGLYGIAMTNTTAAVLAGQLYLYGGATNLMLLNTNSGLSGVTYFKNSGVSAGSWGNATPPTPSKVLQISVDGTLYYLPLVAQNT